MSSTLQQLLRVREQDKRRARQLLSQAQGRETEQHARIEKNRAELADARDHVDASDPTLMSHYHSYQLRMEMERRRQERGLEHASAAVEAAREGLRHRVREHHVIGAVLERRAEQARVDARKAETAVFDELAVQGWWRESA